MRDLTDKLVWITGAGSGIGAAAARRLAEAGCRLVLSGRRPEPLRALADEIGAGAHVELLDVADRVAVAATGARIAAEHGAVDTLVNSAGINVPKRFWRDLDHDDWESVFRINVDGIYYCTQAVLPAMRERRDGLIVNISSWVGVHVSQVTGPAYTGAKHAVNAMTETLNIEEGANGIRACAICPGEVATEILDRRPVPIPAETRARMLQPDDLGETVWFVVAQPPHVCLNQILVSPTWNRLQVGGPEGAPPT